MKTLLINLPHHNTPYPLGLACVAGHLQHDVVGLDAHWWQANIGTKRSDGSSGDVESLIKGIIAAEQPDMIGLTLHQFTERDISWIAKLRKYHAGLIVAGGASVSIPEHGEAVLRSSELDVVVMGDGEETARQLEEIVARKEFELLKTVEGISYKNGLHIVSTPPRSVQYSIDGYYPNTDIFPGLGKGIESYGEIALYTSRGCFWNCSYCSVTNIAKKIGVKKRRSQSASRVIDGIDRIARFRPIDALNFFDDDFLGLSEADFQRALDIFKGLGKYRSLRKVFFETTPRAVAHSHKIAPEFWETIRRLGGDGKEISISVGIESMSSSILNRMGKKTNRDFNLEAASIVRKYASNKSTMTYIMYLDHKVTLDELRETVFGFYDVLEKLPSAPHKDLLNKPMIPTRGSATWYELQSEKNLVEYKLPIEIDGYKSLTTYRFRYDDVAKAYLLIEYFKDALHNLYSKGVEMRGVFSTILHHAGSLAIPASEIVPIGAYYDINFKKGFMARLKADEATKSIRAALDSAGALSA